MSIDIGFHGAVKDFLLQWLEGRGELLVYMPRYNSQMNVGLCPRCTDSIEQMETDPNCPICFGTGFWYGWGSPYTGINSPYQRVYGIFSYNTVITDWGQTGRVTTEQDQKLSIALTQQPSLGDLIIDSHGNRYRVGVHVTDWIFNNDHIGWHITAAQMSSDDIAMTVPIPAYAALLQRSGQNYSQDIQLKVVLPEDIILKVQEF